MPIFEYQCSACTHRFETLVQGTAPPRCPKCTSDQLEKQFSVFGVGKPAGTSADEVPAAPGCNRCGDPRGPGACAWD